MSDSESSPSSASKQSPLPSTKRKRDADPLQEIHVDVNAPEPPSKKALRRAKKGKPLKSTQQVLVNDLFDPDPASDDDLAATAAAAADTTTRAASPPKRSEHAIWIGNLPWTLSPADLEAFLTGRAHLAASAITRVHLPGPTRETLEAWRQKTTKPLNRGFAYVDVAAPEDVAAVVALSETLLGGRRVLVKDAGSFEGRPAPAGRAEGGDRAAHGGTSTAGATAGNPPSKKIFVGNVTFDAQSDELRGHFEQCGLVEDVFLTTFEDTGKCKGYGWVTFAEIEAAEKAVRGWVEKEDDADPDLAEGDEEGEAKAEDEPGLERTNAATTKTTTKPRMRKWWVNRFQGRPLRMEFAEDKTTRYKKRFGKGGTALKGGQDERPADDLEAISRPAAAPPPASHASKRTNREAAKKTQTPRPDLAARRIDARTIKPGSALAHAQRSTAAMVAGQGTKITFA